MLSRFEIQMLLDELCVAEGFCLPPGAALRLAADAPDDVIDFTDALLRAEGIDPRLVDRRLYLRVRTLVADAFRMGG